MSERYLCTDLFTGAEAPIDRNLAREELAWREGWEACMDGLEVNCNPYTGENETTQAQAWYNGWAAAEAD